jgi:1,4-dihydroxy-2-naphthoate octaprenyltransferase
MNKWILATRPWSFPASFMPALLGFVYSFWLIHSGTFTVSDYNIGWLLIMMTSSTPHPDWAMGLLAIVGAVLFQIAGNLLSDYYDYRQGVDRKDTFGSSRLLVEGVFKPRTIWIFGAVTLVVGSLLGLLIAWFSGPQLIWIGFVGFIAAYFYYLLKYHALGDLCIFIIYGLLIPLGTVYAMLWSLDWHVLVVSAPLGFLIVNILHANNTRDIQHDRRAQITTQAMLLGLKGSKIQYLVLTIAAYVGIVLCVAFRILPWLSLVVLVTIPIAVRNVKCILAAQPGHPEMIRDLDGMTAQLVMTFGGTLAAMIAISLLF